MGVELERCTASPDTRAAMRQKLGLKDGDVALIYPAEFSDRKNQAMLLRAMESLPDHVKLLLPGRGALLEDVKAQARDTGLTHRVLFPGFVTDIPGWLAASDIAVSSSRSEGLPFNIMEAMAAGLPVAASDVKGHTDLITPGETGLLCPYDDAAAFAAAILRLTEDSALRAQMGRAGKAQVQRYRLDAVLPQVMALYLSAAKETNT